MFTPQSSVPLSLRIVLRALWCRHRDIAHRAARAELADRWHDAAAVGASTRIVPSKMEMYLSTQSTLVTVRENYLYL